MLTGTTCLKWLRLIIQCNILYMLSLGRFKGSWSCSARRQIVEDDSHCLRRILCFLLSYQSTPVTFCIDFVWRIDPGRVWICPRSIGGRILVIMEKLLLSSFLKAWPHNAQFSTLQTPILRCSFLAILQIPVRYSC